MEWVNHTLWEEEVILLMLVTIEMDLQVTEVKRELLKSLSGHITVH